MDFDFIKEVIPLYAEATLLTLRIGFIGIILSFFLGIFCAIVRYWKIPVLNALVRVYTELSRNTPLLIQLFFLAFHISSFFSYLLSLLRQMLCLLAFLYL